MSLNILNASLIPELHAQEAAPPPASGGGFLLFMLVLFAMMYFLMIRPQLRRAKQHREMVQALKKGDEIITNGGLLGRIRAVGENFLLVEVANGVEVRVQKQAVANPLPKGTCKGQL